MGVAIQEGDMNRFSHQLEQVARCDMALAQSLRQLADQYEYDTLSQILAPPSPLL